MKLSRWAPRSAVAVTAGLAVAAGLPVGLASAQSNASGPMVKLVVAQKTINVPSYGKGTFIDPGVYVTAVGSPLLFDVQRASYAKPLTITQISPVRRSLPGWTVTDWQGLHRFIRITVKNLSGKVVASFVGPFCPNSFDPQRSNPNSPATSPFPQQCGFNPFQLGSPWGIQRGWGVDAGAIGGRIRLGKYTVTVNITRQWQRFLHLTRRAATATVNINVVKPTRCPFPCVAQHATKHPASRGVLPSLPTNVPTVSNPPASELPDLMPLPSWGISVFHFRTKTSAVDSLAFGATVWVGGHSRLDVEGFRTHGSPIMTAYQYFWRNG